ncbi:ABC transporter substrate-binding protein [Skermanella mucosa]|uniref:ABC transporter substrate-binding protein n=1 Tax=Skermanella mucosa TaxID=1789672 RepID=UPI00192CD8EC
MRLATFITSIGAAGLLATLAGTTALADDRPLRIVGPWEIVGVDPAQSGYVFSRTQVAETLVTADGEGRLAPLLAESWSASDDGLTWRFPVRSGATFHDGTPVTAEAAAASLERARAGAGAFAQAPIASIAAEGREVVIRLDRPFASLPAFLANYGTIILAPASYDPAGAVTRIIGSGPYKVKALTPPLKLELERADGWWGGTPAIASASYLAVGQGETRALMAESGEADLVFSMLPVSVERLKRNPRLDVHVTTIPRTRQLKLNAGSPFFDDVRERRAVSLALDRAGIAKVILRNGDLAATQLFPPTLAGWHDEKLPPLERDLDAARRLLAEAGWTAGADGILEQDGRRFGVSLVTFSSWPELPPVATAIQAQLRQVGIEVKVSVGNSSEIVSRHRDGSLEMGLASRNFSLVPDPLGTLMQDYGPKGGDWGAMGWSSAELGEVFRRLDETADAAARLPLQGRAAEILHEGLPVVPVAWSELAVAANKRISGVRVDPFELSYHIASIKWAD